MLQLWHVILISNRSVLFDLDNEDNEEFEDVVYTRDGSLCTFSQSNKPRHRMERTAARKTLAS